MSKKSSIKIRSGKFEFIKLNADERDIRDLYHWTLTLSWPQFSALVLGLYLAINVVFSLLYYLDLDGIAGAEAFSDAFFFSVETLATVGYGHFYPQTFYVHLVATLEIMVGMFGMAVITGLIFIRFTRPMARLVFSRNLVVAPFDGQPALMMRVANLRQQAMVEAEFRLMLVRSEMTREGDVVRRFYPLTLQFDRLIVFPVALTIRHIIDEKSPLFGQTPKELEQSDARFIASIVCIDSVIPAPVQSQQDYGWADVLFNKRFVEIYTDVDKNRMIVDYGRLHDVEDVPSAAAS